MKKKFTMLLASLFLAMGATDAQVTKYYKPGERKATFEADDKVMFYNTAINGDQDRTGFLIDNGSNFGHSKQKPSASPIFSEKVGVWTIKVAEDNTTYYKVNVKGTNGYVGIRGATNNAQAKDLFFHKWTESNKGAGVNSENVDGQKVLNADIAEEDMVWVVAEMAGDGGTTWNGEVNGFTTWSTGHPYAIYSVVEATTAELETLLANAKTTAKNSLQDLAKLSFTTAQSAITEIDKVAMENNDLETALNEIDALVLEAKKSLDGKCVKLQNHGSGDRDGKYLGFDNVNNRSAVVASNGDDVIWTIKLQADNTSFKLYNFVNNLYLGAPSSAATHTAEADAPTFKLAATTKQGYESTFALVCSNNEMVHVANHTNYKLMAHTDLNDGASLWTITSAGDIVVTREQYDLAAAAKISLPYAVQQAYGLVTDAANYYSNYKSDAEGSYAALLDDTETSYFHSAYNSEPGDGSGVHYIQADLGEGNSIDEFYFYMKPRSGNGNNRPKNITVYGSNDINGEFTKIADVTTTLDGSMNPYLSAKLGTDGTNYRYIRLTVTSTNTGSKFFTLSELYFFPANSDVTSLVASYNAFSNASITSDAFVEVATALLDAETILALSNIKKEAYALLNTNESNHAANPNLGQYTTEAYNALKTACEANDATEESIREAIAAFKASKNLPVFMIGNVKDYAKDKSIYDNNSGTLYFKATNVFDKTMWWALDQTTTTVGVTENVGIYNVGTGNGFWGASSIKVTETNENEGAGIADDGLFLFYTTGSNTPVHFQDAGQKIVRYGSYEANSGSAAMFTYIGNTYDLNKLTDEYFAAANGLAAITVPEFNFAAGVNNYDEATKPALDEAIANRTDVLSKLLSTADEIAAAKTQLEAAIASVKLNMPESGHYYRIRCTGDGMKRIQSTIGGNDNRLEMKSGDEGINDGSIFHYVDGGLKSYTEKKFINAYRFEDSENVPQVTFSTAGHGAVGCYYINIGGRYIFGAGDQIDSGSGTPDNRAGYTWWLEPADDVVVKNYKTSANSTLDTWEKLSVLFDAEAVATAKEAVNALTDDVTELAEVDEVLQNIRSSADGKSVKFENCAADNRGGRFLGYDRGNARIAGVLSNNDDVLWTIKFVDNNTFKLYNFINNIWLGGPDYAYDTNTVTKTETRTETNENGEEVEVEVEVEVEEKSNYRTPAIENEADAVVYKFIIRDNNKVTLSTTTDKIAHLGNSGNNYRIMEYGSDSEASNWSLVNVGTIPFDREGYNAFVSGKSDLMNRLIGYAKQLQDNYGLVKSGEGIQVVVNHPGTLGTGDCQPSSNLLDGDNGTYVHSAYENDDPNVTNHYIEVELSAATQNIFCYFSKRNNNNRPTFIKVYGGKNADEFTENPVATLYMLESLDNNVQSYFSKAIDLGDEYTHLRFAVANTNTDSRFFTLSEFYVLPVNETTKGIADLAGASIVDTDLAEKFTAAGNALKTLLLSGIKLTEKDGDPVWYTIKNTRSGKYASYAGDGVKMTQVDELSMSSLFYFTASDAETADGFTPVMIHNAATTNKLADFASWTAAGNAWFLSVDAQNNPAAGLHITNTAAVGVWNGPAGWNALNDDGGSITNYCALDAGSVFVIEAVEAATISTLADAYKTTAINALKTLGTAVDAAAAETAINAVTVDGGDYGKFVADVDAVVNGLTQYVTFRNADDKEGSVRIDAYLLANMTDEKGHGNKPFNHLTGTWRLEYSGKGSFYIYNVNNKVYLGNPSSNGALTATPNAEYTLEVIENNKVEFKSGGQTLHLNNHNGSGTVSTGWFLSNYDSDDPASRWYVETDFAAHVSTYKTSAIAILDSWATLSVVFDAALIETAKIAISGIETTDYATFAAIDAKLKNVTDKVAEKYFTFKNDDTANANRQDAYLAANGSTLKGYGDKLFDFNAIWRLLSAGGTSFYLYNELNNVYLKNPSSGDLVADAAQAATYTFEIVDAATNKAELKSAGQTLHLAGGLGLMNYDNDDAASRWYIATYDYKADLTALITASENNHAEIPELGQYTTAAYNALVEAGNSATTVAEVAEAIAAFKASLNRPVYFITSKNEGGYSDGAAIYYDGAWKWGTANIYNKQMWMTIPGYTEENVPVVDTYAAEGPSYAICDYLTGTKMRGKDVQIVKVAEWDGVVNLQYGTATNDAVQHAQGGGALVGWNPANVKEDGTKDCGASAWQVEFIGTSYELDQLTDEYFTAPNELAAINVPNFSFAAGVNNYDAATKLALDAAVAKRTDVLGKFSTADEIAAAKALLEDAIAGVQLNMPVNGKFYRVRCADQGTGMRRLQSTINNDRLQMIGGADGINANSIFCYINGSLLSYTTGQYINAYNFDAVGTKSTVTFSNAYNGTLGQYNIKINDTRYIYGKKDEIDSGAGNPTDGGYNWWLEEVTELPVSITAAGYTTLYTSVALEIPAEENLEVYVASSTEEDCVCLKRVYDIIPANTGVVIKSTEELTEAVTYNFAVSAVAATGNVTSLFQGTFAKTLTTPAEGYTCYVLANGTNGVGLYRATLNKNENTAFLNNAWKVYLPVANPPAGQAPRALAFRFGRDNEGTTDLEKSEIRNEKSEMIFDLTGRRIEKIVEKGMYIVNGKKVIFR